ncbi:MAG: response regulator [Candidatus Electrothrix sp. AW1]|nr:response regulator [Candidatus Electrothrix sp. AX1]MCI5181793.1 response regulator [Candidatus Electrothrix gigas]MCI5225802.1 response regulator [Candidatus Electrothrix gigas]
MLNNTMLNNTSVGLKQLRLCSVTVLLFWSLLLSGSLWLYVRHEWQSVEFIGKKIGLTAVQKDYIYELWNAHNGGIYVPVNSINQPNPYLKDFPDRDVVTLSGKKLTLINPAQMTRQAYQLERKLYGTGGHTVSLDAVRPENTPDEWERKALISFTKGKKDAATLLKKDNRILMRVIIPVIIEKSCIRCHIRQGKQINALQGGLSITFFIDSIVALFQQQFKTSALYHLLIYLIGIIGLVIFYTQTSRQITRRAIIEKCLRRKKEEWEKTFDAIPDIITLQDSKLRIIRANQATYDFFQTTPEKVIGSPCYSLFQKDTTICPNCPGVRSIIDGTQHCSTVEYKLKDKFFHICSAPVVDEKNNFQYFVYIARNITDKKNLEEELFQARKMEAIGTLAGGIAHDFNNILAAILGYTEMIKLSLPENSPLENDLDQIVLAGNRATGLIKQILTFSRKKKEQKEELQIDQVVREAVKMMRSSLPTTISIQEDIDEQCGVVFADPTNIHQIILNLFTNGFHAIGNKQGILQLSLKPVDIPPEQVADKPTIKPGSFVRLTVQDNGQGIDDVTMHRIFDPYFTTKDQGDGTGLGLAVIHGIVENYKGFIEVESMTGQGTAFHIFLPTLNTTRKNEALPETDPHAPLPRARGNEHILFVDDEVHITRINHTLLSNLGYRVTTETHSLAALKKVQENPTAFDLLITDHTMPELTGTELAQAVLQLRPDLPVILCTGYTAACSQQDALQLGIKQYVIKPLSTKKLARIVREVLDESKEYAAKQ